MEKVTKGGWKYLMASRMGSVKEIKEEVLTRGGRETPTIYFMLQSQTSGQRKKSS